MMGKQEMEREVVSKPVCEVFEDFEIVDELK